MVINFMPPEMEHQAASSINMDRKLARHSLVKKARRGGVLLTGCITY